MKTIEQLNATIEELEKRIKAISMGQNTLSQLIAIREYIDLAQGFLSDLNSNLDNHIQNCTDYSQDITTIKSQIETINSTLDGLDKVNNEQIQEITTKLNALSTKVDNFLGDSTNSLSAIETDILALQTDLSSTQDDIETLNTSLSSTNSTVGEHTTTITNLQATQTSLQTAQTNLQTTLSSQVTNISKNTNDITGIKTRLTTAENNISALTGGVDVGNLENRINEIDEQVQPVYTGSYIHRFKDYGAVTINTPSFASLPIAFSCSSSNELRVKVTIKCTIPTRIIYSDPQIQIRSFTGSGHTYHVNNLDKTKTEFAFEYTYIPEYRYEELMVYFMYCHGIVVNSIELDIYGSEIKVFDNYRDLNVVCFNNERYLTYKKNGTIYYGKYTSTDVIDLDNIPNTYTPPTELENDCFYNFIYMPAIKYEVSSVDYSKNADGYLYFSAVNHYMDALTPPTDDATKYKTNCVLGMYGLPILGYKRPFLTKPWKGRPAGTNMNVNNGYTTYEYVERNKKGEWLAGFDIFDNYLSNSSSVTPITNFQSLYLHENGYIYYFQKEKLDYILKIAKGEFAIGYKQTDGSINVYITRKHNVYKYTLTLDSTTNKYTSNYIKCYEKCDLVFEILYNQIIKCYQGTWSFESEEYNT